MRVLAPHDGAKCRHPVFSIRRRVFKTHASRPDRVRTATCPVAAGQPPREVRDETPTLTAIVAVASPSERSPAPSRPHRSRRGSPCLQAGCRRASRRARARRSTSARLQVARCGPGMSGRARATCLYRRGAGPPSGSIRGRGEPPVGRRRSDRHGSCLRCVERRTPSPLLVRAATPSFLNDLVVTDTAVYATDSLQRVAQRDSAGRRRSLAGPRIDDDAAVERDPVRGQSVQRQRHRRRARLADRRRHVHRRPLPCRPSDR